MKILENKSGFLRYLKNTSWLMGEKVIRLFIALFVGVWVTRYLGPEDFGILSYAQSFVGLFTALSSLGLNDILVRELIKYKENSYVLLGTAFGLQTIGSLFILICLLTNVYTNDNEPLTNKIILILGMITFIQSFGVISSYFSSLVKSKYVAIPGLIGLIISSLFKISLILSGASLIYFVYVLVFDVIFIATGLLYFYFKLNQNIFKW